MLDANKLKNRLMTDVGLTEEQVYKTEKIIKEFISEEIPMLASMINSFFPSSRPEPETEAGADGKPDDLLGDLGKKVEGFLKNMTDEAKEDIETLKKEADNLWNKGKDFQNGKS